MLTVVEILTKIRTNNRRYGVHVPCPYLAYTQKSFYTAQVKIRGSIYYYQLPKSQGSRNVAWWKDDGQTEPSGKFDWDGLELPDV